MKVGDVVKKFEPTFGTDYQTVGKPPSFDATVVYIHPKRRFLTVEFCFKYGKFRESFRFH